MFVKTSDTTSEFLTFLWFQNEPSFYTASPMADSMGIKPISDNPRYHSQICTIHDGCMVLVVVHLCGRPILPPCLYDFTYLALLHHSVVCPTAPRTLTVAYIHIAMYRSQPWSRKCESNARQSGMSRSSYQLLYSATALDFCHSL